MRSGIYRTPKDGIHQLGGGTTYPSSLSPLAVAPNFHLYYQLESVALIFTIIRVYVHVYWAQSEEKEKRNIL